MFSQLGHVPTDGEAVEVDGYQLVAERVQGRRIDAGAHRSGDRGTGDDGAGERAGRCRSAVAGGPVEAQRRARR